MLNRLVFMYNVCERVIWPGLVAVGLWEVCLSSVIIRYNPDKRRPQERITALNEFIDKRQLKGNQIWYRQAVL